MKKIQSNDAFQRINYLYQISKLMSENKNFPLSSYYGNLICNIAKKNVLKIHPDIKRQICKKCRCMLKDKRTAQKKIINNNNLKNIQWTCSVCKEKKKLPANKNGNHEVWTQKSEAVIETIS